MRKSDAAPVHHVGISVSDLQRAAGFWERFSGNRSRDRRLLEGPGLDALTGYKGTRIDSCWVDLPGGMALELLDYLHPEEPPNPDGTAHPGNVHLCFTVLDIDAAHAHAVRCGARPVAPAPTVVGRGPRAGTRVAYLRAPDGVTIELRQERSR